jgi:type VI protein secretion system component VasK
VFIGFYFTSAVRQGEATRARNQVASDFALTQRAEHTTAMVMAEHGFPQDLFSRVVRRPRPVRQHASRTKRD